MKQKQLFPGIPSKPKKAPKDVTIQDWKIPSFTSEREYLVTQTGSKWSCDCPHFQSRKRQCKHIQWKKQQLGLIKEDLSGFKSAIQKSIRRGNLSLLRLSFQQLWEKDKRWLLWRLPILAGEEVESYVGMTGRVLENPSREAVWELLARMTLSLKSKEAEGIRVASHILLEEKWRPEDWVQGEYLEELREWMDVQIMFHAAGKDKKGFWQWFEDRFQVPEGYQRETVTVCKKRSGKGGMSGDVELVITVAWLAAKQGIKEPEIIDVPREEDVKAAERLPWYVFDGHTSIGKIVHYQLRKLISDKKEWAYVTDDLQFNMESAKVDQLVERSFWWAMMLKMLWAKYGRTEEQAQKDWETWRPRIQALIEKSMSNQHVRKE